MLFWPLDPAADVLTAIVVSRSLPNVAEHNDDKDICMIESKTDRPPLPALPDRMHSYRPLRQDSRCYSPETRTRRLLQYQGLPRELIPSIVQHMDTQPSKDKGVPSKMCTR